GLSPTARVIPYSLCWRGSLVGFTRDMKKERRALYGRMFHHKRGSKVCRNPVLIRQDKLDQVVLDAIVEALDERRPRARRREGGRQGWADAGRPHPTAAPSSSESSPTSRRDSSEGSIRCWQERTPPTSFAPG